MSANHAINIPDHLYQRVKAVAENENRPVADVLNEALAAAFPAIAVHPGRAQMQREEAAFAAQHAALLERYAGQYVAIHGGAVVDHDIDRVALVTRLNQSHKVDIVLVRQVTREPDPVLHLRSPRLIRE